MKVLGIDDNSEAFSLLITVIIGVLLFSFTYALNKKVMGSKIQSDVSSTAVVAQPCEVNLFNKISLFWLAEHDDLEWETVVQWNQQRHGKRSLEAQLKATQDDSKV